MFTKLIFERICLMVVKVKTSLLYSIKLFYIILNYHNISVIIILNSEIKYDNLKLIKFLEAKPKK